MIPPISGKVVGGEQMVAKITSLRAAIREELEATVSKLGDDVLARVKAKLSGPVLKAPTGNLRGSINKLMENTGDSIKASIGTSTAVIPYARIHEYGGVITPKNGPYLRFKTPDGKWHQVKSVTIPERSYLRSSLAEVEPIVATQIKAACRRAIQRVGLA